MDTHICNSPISPCDLRFVHTGDILSEAKDKIQKMISEYRQEKKTYEFEPRINKPFLPLLRK